MTRFYEGKRINLREADAHDAEFTLELRLANQHLNEFLTKIDNDVEKQRRYIINHQNKGEDCYFIMESKDGERYGTVRMSDVTEDSFLPGSWIIKKGAPGYVAYETYFTIFDYAFIELNKKHCVLDVKKNNIANIKLHTRMGAIIRNENSDDDRFFFDFSRETYLKARKKYERFTINRDDQINKLIN